MVERLTAELNDAASEFANSPCEIDAAGDVWDARGYWWSDDRKIDFCHWLRVGAA